MNLKVSAASDNLAHMIKRKLGTKIQKITTKEVIQKDPQASLQKHGVCPQYTFNSKDTLQQRALKRQQLSLLRKQQNIESIMALALEYCPAVNAETDPDPDWVERFITLAEDSSNKAMQQLWAKILAGETVKPGTFSYKSLLTLKQMTQRESDALHSCISLYARSVREKSSLILLGYYKKPSIFNFFRLQNKLSINLSKCGLSFPQVLTLVDIDLIYDQEIESAELENQEEYVLKFYQTELTLKAKTSGIVLTYYKLTQTGHELVKLSQLPVNTHFKAQLEKDLSKDFELSWRESKGH